MKMRGKVSRVILVCTLLVALAYAGWWPFKKDEEDSPRKRRGRRQRDEEPVSDTVEQEWDVNPEGSNSQYDSGERRRGGGREPPQRPSGQRSRSRKPKNRDEMEDKRIM